MHPAFRSRWLHEHLGLGGSKLSGHMNYLQPDDDEWHLKIPYVDQLCSLVVAKQIPAAEQNRTLKAVNSFLFLGGQEQVCATAGMLGNRDEAIAKPIEVKVEHNKGWNTSFSSAMQYHIRTEALAGTQVGPRIRVADAHSANSNKTYYEQSRCTPPRSNHPEFYHLSWPKTESHFSASSTQPHQRSKNE